jgi:hypothetical protein
MRQTESPKVSTQSGRSTQLEIHAIGYIHFVPLVVKPHDKKEANDLDFKRIQKILEGYDIKKTGQNIRLKIAKITIVDLPETPVNTAIPAYTMKS